MDPNLRKRKMKIVVFFMLHLRLMNLKLINDLTLILLLTCFTLLTKQLSNKRRKLGDNYDRQVIRDLNLERMIFVSDLACFENTRMDKRAFSLLCNMLQGVGKLEPSRNMGVEEMVAMFLHILAHDEKTRVIKRQFMRSQETISRRFNDVLLAVLRCHNLLLKKPQPISEGNTSEQWKWFKNCLGALDGTHIEVNVCEADKPRYRNRKCDITTNVLGVVTHDLHFIYVLAGWEGSTTDSRILRDALSRTNGLKVPQGYYYLCDAGYMNCERFLTPYRGQRYHLSDYNTQNRPTTPKEFFNMKHSKARNVVERAFGILKARWTILRGKSFYPIKTRGRIITACCLLYNHVRNVMRKDSDEDIDHEHEIEDIDFDGQMIHHIETSDNWSRWRDNLAQDMWNQWRNRRQV